MIMVIKYIQNKIHNFHKATLFIPHLFIFFFYLQLLYSLENRNMTSLQIFSFFTNNTL